MADIRINALANTATSAASDDYLALDGSANGTRKILATNVAQNVTDVTLGSAGPSVKSTLSARAPRQGLVFDGTDTSTISTAVPAFGTADFSVSTWLYTDLTVNVQGFIGSTVVGGIGFYTLTDGTIGRQKLGTGGDSTPAGVISANKWSLFTYTRASGVATFYVNGLSVYSVADTFNYTQTISMLGGFAGGNNYKGTVAPLIYNRALSASEVVALYEAGAPSGADYNSASNTSVVTGFLNGTYTTFTGASATGFTATSSGGSAYATCLPAGNTQPVIKAGSRVRVSFTATLTSGVAPTFQMRNNASGDEGTFVVTAGSNSQIITMSKPSASDGLGNCYFGSNGATNYTISNFSLTNLGLLLAPDAAQAGNGLVWTDLSGNGAHVVLPTSGVSWNVKGTGAIRVRGATYTNGNQLLLGAATVPVGYRILSIAARLQVGGTPNVTLGSSSGSADYAASTAITSTSWKYIPVASGGEITTTTNFWVGSSSTAVVFWDITAQPLDY